MSKINNLIKKLCPNGVEKVSLGSLMNRIKEKNYDNSGIEIVYSVTKEKGIVKSDDLHDFNVYSSDLSNYSILRKNQYAYNPARLNIGSIARLKSDEVGLVSPMYIVFELDQNKIDFEYFEHLLFSERVFNNMCSFVEQGARFRFDYKNWNKIIIDLPPLQIQKEIVNILNKFIEMQKVLESELEVRKNQYEFWREKLFELDECEWKTTEELFDTITDYVANGSFKSIADNVSYKNEKDYAVLLRTVDYSNGYDNNKFIYIDEHAYNFLSKSKLFGGEIIINNIGAGVGTTFLCPDLGMPMSLAPNTIMMRTPNNKFYYYWFNSKRGQESIESITAKSAMPKFNKTGFRKLLVPVPTLEKQNKIVETLDKFEKLISDISIGLPAEIELRRKQYEYYRNKLLSFEELSVSE